jgi:hypothetical protein
VKRPLLLLALLPACAACLLIDNGARSEGTGPINARRVVLLSLDGLGAQRHGEMLSHGVYTDPDGLSAFAASPWKLERAIPVNPTLTAVNHVTMATGALPSVTGIVSNWFHLPHDPVTRSVSGFVAASQAEFLWQSFRRQNRRVGCLAFAGCDGRGTARTADFGVIYPAKPLIGSDMVSILDADFVPSAPGPDRSTFSPVRRAEFVVSEPGTGAPFTAVFGLTALDSTDDGVVNYDALLVSGNSMQPTLVKPGEWFALRVARPHPDGGRQTIGAWCLLRSLPADLSKVTIYRGGFNASEAYPREFRERLEAGTGFWPGAPDEDEAGRGLVIGQGLSLSEFVAQARRFSEYLSTCARLALEQERPDLLLAYQPIIDEAQHTLELSDPRQRDAAPLLVSAARGTVAEIYRIADHAVGNLARSLDLGRDALVVVSDHGILPTWETVYVNQLLQLAGLARAEPDGTRYRVAPDSRMVAQTSGACAHLYVNLQGRESGGVVPPAERAATVQAAANFLATVQVAGSNVVEAMFRHEELARVGLDNPNSGDLVVFLYPGFSASSRISAPGAAFHEPTVVYGQHGHLNTHPELAAVWLARGAAVPALSARERSLVEVAGFVSYLAGVAPPAQGRPWRP